MPVTLTRDGAIALLIINNPPVNAMGHAVRAALKARLDEAVANPEVQAIVLACAGRTFVAGADIAEFGKPRAEPLTATLAAALEQSPKPVVAALHGTALGGGLEIALGCHWRIAAAETRMGLPEVKLGLCPGGGGTQRLPRAVGTTRALEMIAGGEMIAAPVALEAGLIDEIAGGELRPAAMALARRVLAEKLPIRRLSEIGVAAESPDTFNAFRDAIRQRQRGREAPLKAIDAVAAASLPFAEGIAVERATFIELEAGAQSRALRHAFFAERETAKVPGLATDLKLRDIARAAVIGAGTMGSGIALCFAQAGIPVTLIESDRTALERGLAALRRNAESLTKRQSWDAGAFEQRLALVTSALELDAAVDADIVVEAVFEELDLKRHVFAALDRIAKPGAILATNTSYQDVDAIAAATKRPEDVLGLHFFSPAHIMRLVEVVRAKRTAPAVLSSALALARKLKKLPVVVGAAPGFVGNRLLYERSRAAELLLQEGASPAEIDRAMIAFSFPMGPFAASDLAGLDVSFRARRATGQSSPIADALAEAGRHGQKTGGGYYRYAPGSRKPEPDPEADAIVARVRNALGATTRRDFTVAAIVERLIYPMVNEGARLLESGIALRPGDIDMVCIHGYGFPAQRGGPMFYADEVGLRAVRDSLDRLARASGDATLVPAPLIERRLKEGRGFFS